MALQVINYKFQHKSDFSLVAVNVCPLACIVIRINKHFSPQIARPGNCLSNL